MFENENKTDCMNSLIFGISRTGDWHRFLANRFPTDLREFFALPIAWQR